MPRRTCSPKRASRQPILDDIAHAAGYTKGAIYKHFTTKEDLFLAVSDRYWRRYFDNFAEVMSSAKQIGSRELDEIAARWRRLSRDRGAEHAALGHEFTLYLLRNPEARERVAEKRSEVVEALAKFIVEGVDRLGGALLIPPLTFAQVLVATSDSSCWAANSTMSTSTGPSSKCTSRRSRCRDYALLPGSARMACAPARRVTQCRHDLDCLRTRTRVNINYLRLLCEAYTVG